MAGGDFIRFTLSIPQRRFFAEWSRDSRSVLMREPTVEAGVQAEAAATKKATRGGGRLGEAEAPVDVDELAALIAASLPQ